MRLAQSCDSVSQGTEPLGQVDELSLLRGQSAPHTKQPSCALPHLFTGPVGGDARAAQLAAGAFKGAGRFGVGAAAASFDDLGDGGEQIGRGQAASPAAALSATAAARMYAVAVETAC